MKQNNNVGYANYTSIIEDCVDGHGFLIDSLCVLTYGDIFYVKVKDAADLDALENTIEKTNTVILSQDDRLMQWFTLYADKNSMGNALEMANYFIETGLFLSAQPSFAKFVVE